MPGRSSTAAVFLVHTVVSLTAVLYQLPAQSPASKGSKILHKLWDSGDTHIILEEAQILGHDVLSSVLESQLGLFAAANCVVSLWLAAAWLTKHLFLGAQPLSMTESAKLADRLLKFVMVKVVFLASLVDPTLSEVTAWLAWLCVFGFMRLFVCLACERCEALLSSPSSSPHQHIRCLALIFGILGNDAAWILSYMSEMRNTSLSLAALWLFDAIIVAIEAIHALVKYSVQALQLRREKNSDSDSKENECAPPATLENDQGTFLFHLDLVVDLVIGSLTLAHYAHLWHLHGLRLQLIDAVLFLDVRLLSSSIVNRLKGYAKYRKLTKTLKYGLPDACADDLKETTCAICMDTMKAAKVLPCKHMFHVSCLRAWLHQSKTGVFTCPLCRQSLVVETVYIPRKCMSAITSVESGESVDWNGHFAEERHTAALSSTGTSTRSRGDDASTDGLWLRQSHYCRHDHDNDTKHLPMPRHRYNTRRQSSL